MKTKKIIQKRVKKTKNGKILVRAIQQDHFLAKKSGDITRKKRKIKPASKILTRLTKINL
ncbi:MAG TPA: 50S ribosomal protein L35 [Candidatus Portnoybacteria bacterium]|nr:50S ribosomal protein L35 [Candidatus Portnoybacteria bacterium]